MSQTECPYTIIGLEINKAAATDGTLLNTLPAGGEE